MRIIRYFLKVPFSYLGTAILGKNLKVSVLAKARVDKVKQLEIHLFLADVKPYHKDTLALETTSS